CVVFQGKTGGNSESSKNTRCSGRRVQGRLEWWHADCCFIGCETNYEEPEANEYERKRGKWRHSAGFLPVGVSGGRGAPGDRPLQPAPHRRGVQEAAH